MSNSFTTGSLVAVRGREWVVVEALGEGALSIRPLGGLDDDAQVLFPALEHDLKPATFAHPASNGAGPSAEARLLREVTASQRAARRRSIPQLRPSRL